MIVEHFKFNSRVRNANENLSVFVAELRKLTEYYEYGDSLKDRLFCGINHKITRQRLLSESSALTLEKSFGESKIIRIGNYSKSK